MKKKWKRLLSLLLAFAMAFSMIPMHAHAEESAHINGVTLTSGGVTVAPAEVLDNVVVYDIYTAEAYTLSTTDDNTYGVFFRSYFSTEWDEDWEEYRIIDSSVDVTLDNVTIRTEDPCHEETEGDAVNKYAALMFWAADMTLNGVNRQDYNSMEAYLYLKGTNTIELLGVENDADTTQWSAIAFANCFGGFYGEGSNATLNAKIAYDNAVGEVAAIRSTSGVGVGLYDDEENESSPVTLNVVAQVTGADGTLYGNGIDVCNYRFSCMDGAKLNIVAGDTGILRRYVKYCNSMEFYDSTVNIAAGKAAMINEGEPEAWNSNVSNHKLCKIYFTNCNVTVDGIHDGDGNLVKPLQSGINAAHSIIIDNSTVTVNAVDAALDTTYDLGGNQSYNHKSTTIWIKNNSEVTVTGSMGEAQNVHGSDIAAVDAGSYYSDIDVETGSKLTVNAGWMAMVANDIYARADGELYVTTTKPSTSGALGCYYLHADAANSSKADSKPGKIRIDSAAERLGAGQGKYLYSNDVWIHTSSGAPINRLMLSHTTTLGDDILLMESADGVNWLPISLGRNTLDEMRYLTTIPQESHICQDDDDDRLTFDVDNSQHSGLCIACGQAFTSDCVHSDETPAYHYHPDATTDGTRYWECLICEGETPEIVPAHVCKEHSDNIWIKEDYSYHVSHCTFEYGDNKVCNNTIIQRHVMTGEFHVDATTIRDECTVCDFFREYTGSANAVYVPAKEGDCQTVGNIAFWACSHCYNYFADETCKEILTPAEVFIQPGPHSYGADGVCTVCGNKNSTLNFVPEEGFPNEYEYYYVILGKASDGTYYVMGNDTVDGKREAVEIPAEMIAADGTITLTAEMAEFFYRETIGTSNTGWMADGGCFTFTVADGFYLYNPERYGDKSVSYPGYFYPNYSSDEPGNGAMYAFDRNYDEKVWLYFNEEDLCFDISETEMKNIYLYIQLCDHPDLGHNEYVAPTCTEQGTREFYGCGKCATYYSDAAAQHPYEFPDYVDPFNQSDVNEYFNLSALGHKFDAEGVCEHCSMMRPVYVPVTTLEQFDQLSEDAYYIIVFKDGEKTYAAYLPDMDHSEAPYASDADGNGILDIMEPDANANGIPDCIESYIDLYWGGADFDEDGTTTAEEYKDVIGDTNEDSVVDMNDYQQFFSDYVYWDLYYQYDEEIFAAPNIVEVTIADDGSITIVDEGAMEFQMIPSGVWGGQPYDEYDFEHYGIKDTERMRAAWVPNFWIANGGMMGEYGEGHFMIQNRVFGDRDMPGIIDNKNWKISFNDDGSALLVSTWSYLDDSATLQLVKYIDADGNERITMVGCYDERWQYSDLLMNATVISPAYLYTSEPVYAKPPHECEWGPWVEDDVTDTHTRKCTVEGCNEKQTEQHTWDEGVQTEAPTCTEEGMILYTCPTCGATREETIPALDHDWGEWSYDSVDSHIRYCQRENCDAENYGAHEWGEWICVDDETHKMTCSICEGEQSGDHDWDQGVVTKEPTEWEEGVMTYTCNTCSHTRTEAIDKLVHECTWTDWYPDGEEHHKRHCMDDNCDQFETEPHEWDEGVITTEPTCQETGVKTYTCQVCQHTKTEELPVIDHQWGEWVINKLDEANTHIRFCVCNESQIAPHNFDEGEVTQAPTHEAVGEIKYTCGDCGYSYMEEIPALTEHAWSEWISNGDGTHSRFCICNESETQDCQWDEGVVTDPTCEERGSIVHTCTVCGYAKRETTPALEHDWSDWADTGENSVADIHERHCQRENCDARETGNHEWSAWISTGSVEHKKTCSVCEGTRTASHNWGEGEVVKRATTMESGLMKYTCSDCEATRTEIIPKVECDHTWGKWSADDDETHTHVCINGNGCTAYQRQPHEWDEGEVTTEPTETTEGVMTYTCLICSFEKTETIAMLEHTHRFGAWISDGDETHTRCCENGNTCTVCETEVHIFDAWTDNFDGQTHSGKCSVCGAEVVKPHSWSDWAVGTTESQYVRSCICGAVEEMMVQKPVEDVITDVTDSESNGANAALVVENAMELFNGLLTEEEQEAVAEGNTTVSVYLAVEDIPAGEVAPSDKAAAEEAIGKDDNDLNEDTEIGMYLDINLFKEITTEKTEGGVETTSTETTQITETSNKVTITIRIPDELINEDSSVERIYRIIRVHQDENGNLITEVIEGVFDPETKTFTFETEKFSTYALAYNDEAALIFEDVPEGAWYEEHVAWAVRNGITTGAGSATTFLPDKVCSRAEIVTFLWRAYGSPEPVTTENPFVDIDPVNDAWFFKPVLWAVENGITTGIGNGKFNPFGECSRAEVVTFLWRAAGKPEPTSSENPFVDVDPVEGSWYYKPVLWAVEEGITTGVGNGMFKPMNKCSRAEIVTFLHRAME